MKTPNRSHVLVITAALTGAVLAGLILPGCTSSKVQSGPTATVGQQLQELDKAHKDGIISQKEYERLKKAIIKKND